METTTPTPEVLHGSCHCGRVRVTIPAESTGVVVCHCGDCQKLHGGSFAFFAADPVPAAVGIGSFGPLDLRESSSSWGRITTTPKPGWRDTDVASVFAGRLGVPVGFDTDVNAAALGEQRHGAARGLHTFCYITIGTGIGGGGMIQGRLMHGLLHPEFGHLRIPHDRQRDPFDGGCPFHGDCWEGLASGDAIGKRWGYGAGSTWDAAHVALEAEYIALGLLDVMCVLSPQRLIVGGGVMSEPALLPLVRTKLRALAAGYFDVPELEDGLDEFVVAPALDERAGVIGALELARIAFDEGAS